jgi:hypothetical protein
LNKSISIFLQDLLLTQLVLESRKIYLLSGQYESTQFFNSIFLEEDDLIRALLDNDKVKKLTKRVVRNEGELSTEKGLLFLMTKQFCVGMNISIGEVRIQPLNSKRAKIRKSLLSYLFIQAMVPISNSRIKLKLAQIS